MRRIQGVALLAAGVFCIGVGTMQAGAPRRDIIVEISGLDAAVLPSITPSVRVRATPTDAQSTPVRIGLQVSLTSSFSSQIVLDTSVTALDVADITITRALPSGAEVFFRGYARTSQGITFFSTASSGRQVPAWVRLVSPNGLSGTTVEDKNPIFTWSPAMVSQPPAPFSYEINVYTSPGGTRIFSAATVDTVFRIPVALEFNTPYRWSVTATLEGQPSVRVDSRSSFVIVDEDVPRATILYQTFPNPFPSPLSEFACIWFDLHLSAQVTLDVLDVRTNLVRRLFPRDGASPELSPGRYGRTAGGQTGCAGDFTWNGTNTRGDRVLPGVYILRLRAGTREFTRRILYAGR